ncbi:response regulator [Telluribacter humicola]|uniref:response regulator n=1 Tax=Telluribacter humicola TaxID=1720261 RepID=UPI001A957C2D|nr:response regulator [Telluribacter humicola]
MKKIKIVIVENDEDERYFMKQGFEGSGLFELVWQATNGDDLLEWLETNSTSLPDVILSDLNMPGKNGYDILDYINASPVYSKVPVIVTSCSTLNTTVNRCFAKGAADFVPKPETLLEYTPFVQSLHKQIHQKQLVK